MIYTFLKAFVKPVHRLFYKRVVIEGKNNIPKGAVIFTPNHQNAMMDALAVITSCGRNPYFLARADFFSNPLFRFLFRLLKTIPVYRAKDGVQSLDKNDEVFEKSSKILARGKSLVIFPEAGHNNESRLQALRKGFVRIGFRAEERLNFAEDVYVVPVGMFYSDLTRFRSTLHIRYGKPVSLKNYKELYNKNPQKAYNVVKSNVAKRIIPMILNIKHYEHQQTFKRIVTLYHENLLPQLGLGDKTERNLFLARQKVVYLLNQIYERTPEDFNTLRLKVDDYFNELSRFNFSDNQLRNYFKDNFHLIARGVLLLLTFPVFIYGLIHNIIPYLITKAVTKKNADIHYKSSYKFGLSLLIFPLFYALEIILLSLFFSGPWLLAGYGITLPLTGFAAFYWVNAIRQAQTVFRFQKAEKQKSGEYYDLLQKRQEVIKTLDEAFQRYF